MNYKIRDKQLKEFKIRHSNQIVSGSAFSLNEDIDENTAEILSQFIIIGRNGSVGDTNLVDSLKEDPIFAFGNRKVISYFNNLSNDEQILFFKGLILCGKHFDWADISYPIAPNCLYIIIAKGSLTEEETIKLIDFGFKNRAGKSYIPLAMGFIEESLVMKNTSLRRKSISSKLEQRRQQKRK